MDRLPARDRKPEDAFVGAGFYAGLVAAPLHRRLDLRAIRIGALLGLVQAATAAGYLCERVGPGAGTRPEKRDLAPGPGDAP